MCPQKRSGRIARWLVVVVICRTDAFSVFFRGESPVWKDHGSGQILPACAFGPGGLEHHQEGPPSGTKVSTAQGPSRRQASHRGCSQDVDHSHSQDLDGKAALCHWPGARLVVLTNPDCPFWGEWQGAVLLVARKLRAKVCSALFPIPPNG